MSDYQRDLGKKNLKTGLKVGSIALGMIAMSFAAVPAYRLFCQVTGLGGTPMVVDENETEVLERTITVRFDANTQRDLPWDFKPVEREVTVRLGEDNLIAYTAENLADAPVTGISNFNVTPLKAAQYFNKIQCFCFENQTLQPDQIAHMPVSFFVDPAIADDPLANEVTTITLSYTFFRSLDDMAEDEEKVASAAGNY